MSLGDAQLLPAMPNSRIAPDSTESWHDVEILAKHLYTLAHFHSFTLVWRLWALDSAR